MTIDLDLSRPVISADEAFALLGIDRKTGYRAIQNGSFPIDVIRVGRSIRVPTASLARPLGEKSAAEGYPDPTSSEHAGPSPGGLGHRPSGR